MTITRNTRAIIYLTYTYHRDVFLKGGHFKPWIKNLFSDNVDFEGFTSGMSEPTIKVSLSDFENNKDKIPTKNLIQIRGEFGLLEQLAFGVRNFNNSLIKT